MKIKKILTISILAIVLPTTGWSLWNYLYINRIEEGLVRVNAMNFTGIENLELTGIVYSVQDLEHKQRNKQGYGPGRIIRLNIVKSNMHEYDPRDKQANYFCIIKDGRAEIYAGGPTDLKKGDTLKLNIPERTMSFFTVDGKSDVVEKNVFIGSVPFFNYIKEQGYQEL